MNNPVFAKLVGKKIRQVLINGPKDWLMFGSNDGWIGYHCANDCCNDVWVNHITGLDTLLRHTVVSAENKMWVDVESTRQEYEEAILFSITTEAGTCDIEMRNSHNGYYGGSMEEGDSHYLGDTDALRPILTDF